MPITDLTYKWGLPYFIRAFYASSAAVQLGTAKRVHICPIWIPRSMKIKEVWIWLSTASAGKNLRLGLYADGGGTPASGLLLWDSGNISAGTTGAKGGSLTPSLDVQRGLIWGALATEDAVMAFYRNFINSWLPAGAPSVGIFDGCSYDLAVWGALTNPCPAVSARNIAKVIMHLQVQSFNE